MPRVQRRKVIINTEKNKIYIYQKNEKKYYKLYSKIIKENLKNRKKIKLGLKNKTDEAFKD